MQAQAVRGTKTDVQQVTHTQSLASVQTLLRAGLGCIAYLRDLLPQDNFVQSHMISTDDDLATIAQSSDSFSSPRAPPRRNVNGMKIMTLARGYTEEADKLISYMEEGIFDALQKQYLRSFIFGIYMDKKDPNNIVEAYTFNFQYHQIPGMDLKIPVMSVGKNKNEPKIMKGDAVAAAVRQGKLPTVKDVKKSVRALLKTLIQSITQMDTLPKRRYASFKLFYTETTPLEYEPPCFQAGDSTRDRWVFMTHDLDEEPERMALGKLNTGFHSVDVSVASVSSYLPSATVHDNERFTGTVAGIPTGGGGTKPGQGVLALKEETLLHAADAEKRNVVWAAEAGDRPSSFEAEDADADGEEEDGTMIEYVRTEDGGFVLRGQLHKGPLGVRNDEGEIEPVPDSMQASAHGQFGGVSQVIPTHLKALLSKEHDDAVIEQTQVVDESPDQRLDRTPTRGRLNSIDCQRLQKLNLNNEDTEMLDMETQVVPDEETQGDSIRSFEGQDDDVPMAEMRALPPKRKSIDSLDIMECECGIEREDGACKCEGPCNRWLHVWCMGYHDTKDPRLPQAYICFDCTIKADPYWDLLKLDAYQALISAFKVLATFRRAIKVAEHHGAESGLSFGKKMETDNITSRQMFKRLQTEGFIVQKDVAVDDAEILETHGRSGRGKASSKGKRKTKTRTMRNAKYVFDPASRRSEAYLRYFNPDLDVVVELLNVPLPHKDALKGKNHSDHIRTSSSATIVNSSRSLSALPPSSVEASQTQDDETQFAYPLSPTVTDHMRGRSREREDEERPRKKVKISVAPAIDLVE